MSDSVWPHRQQPIRLHHPWDSPGKNPGAGCYFFLQCMKVKSESEVAQSGLTLSDLTLSPPGSSVHGIFQARVLEWGAIAFSDAHMLKKKNKLSPFQIPCPVLLLPNKILRLVFTLHLQALSSYSLNPIPINSATLPKPCLAKSLTLPHCQSKRSLLHPHLTLSASGIWRNCSLYPIGLLPLAPRTPHIFGYLPNSLDTSLLFLRLGPFLQFPVLKLYKS